MASSCCTPIPVIVISLALLLHASVSPVLSESMANNTFRPRKELLKSRRMRALFKRLNKPSVKTIQSPDGDIIDCVPSHLQPAFDHPRLQGLKPMDPPEKPKGHRFTDPVVDESFQLWRISGKTCPDGTIPVRRTKEEDVLRASSVKRFGRKLAARLRRGSESSSHKASLSKWGYGSAVVS